jgi:hypothetical protein
MPLRHGPVIVNIFNVVFEIGYGNRLFEMFAFEYSGTICIVILSCNGP